MATKPKRIEDMSEEELIRRSTQEYDKVMPSPEPGEQKPKKLAKGGVTRADGCVSKGHTKGRML